MKKLLTLVILSVLLAFIGCNGTQGPARPQGPANSEKIYVWGYVTSTGDTYVGVGLLPVVPWVTVNQETLDIDNLDGGWVEYEDSILVSPGDSLYLKVDYTIGIATASSRVPGVFEITSHDTSWMVRIPVRSDFTVSWSTSSYADFYLVEFYIDYEYRNTLGEYRSFNFSKDTCVTSTSITFPASQLFPADLVSITYSYGYFDVWAINGPILEPGSEGNVTGDGSGFFLGSSYGGGLDILIEGAKEKARKELSQRELMKKLLEKARKIGPNYEALREALRR